MLYKVINLNRQCFHFVFCCIKIKPVIQLPKMPFYAVAKGRTAGIFMDWSACEAQVKGFPGARYKKFNSIVEAQDFITANNNKGISLTPKAIPSNSIITEKNTSLLSNKVTENNFKRSYSSSSKDTMGVQKKKSKRSSKANSFDTDDDDDVLYMTTVVEKQLDDIEARLKKSTKRFNSLLKNNSKVVSKKTKLLQSTDLISEFKMDNEGFVHVYTDGACSSNGHSGARAGIGVYWGEGSSHNVSEPVSGRATNNCGEIQAATRAITQAIDNGVKNLVINTDSKFLINSATKWMPGWKRSGWKLKSGGPVKNEDDFKALDAVQNKINIKWNYVEAHKGVHGNEMADQLAKAGASCYKQ